MSDALKELKEEEKIKASQAPLANLLQESNVNTSSAGDAQLFGKSFSTA